MTAKKIINIELSAKRDPRLQCAIHLQKLVASPLKLDGAFARIRDIVNDSEVSALEIFIRGVIRWFLSYLTKEGEDRND